MAVIPTTVSPREVSASTASDSMAAQQVSIPAPLRCAPAPPCATSNPSALLERRFNMNPSLKVSTFQASLGTCSSAFQAGVGTQAERSEGAGANQAGAGNSPLFNSKPPTLYDVLEVPCTATGDEIKTAYRRLAREHHPDRSPMQEKEASTTKFLQIHSAYSTLSDPRARAQYDLQLSLPSFANASPTFFSSNYCSPRSPFSSGKGRSWETDQCWC